MEGRRKLKTGLARWCLYEKQSIPPHPQLSVLGVPAVVTNPLGSIIARYIQKQFKLSILCLPQQHLYPYKCFPTNATNGFSFKCCIILNKQHICYSTRFAPCWFCAWHWYVYLTHLLCPPPKSTWSLCPILCSLCTVHHFQHSDFMHSFCPLGLTMYKILTTTEKPLL